MENSLAVLQNTKHRIIMCLSNLSLRCVPREIKTCTKKKICFIYYAKSFDCVDHNKLWKILQEMGISDHLTCLLTWETHMQVKKQQLESGMEQWTGSKLGKEYVKAVYCHPAYLTYMQSTSCKIPGWRNHRWNEVCRESNINNLRHADGTTLRAKVKRN